MIVSNPIFEYREYVSVKIDRGGFDENLGQRMSFKDQILTEIERPTVWVVLWQNSRFEIESKYCWCVCVCVPVISKPVLSCTACMFFNIYTTYTGLEVQRLGLRLVALQCCRGAKC